MSKEFPSCPLLTLGGPAAQRAGSSAASDAWQDDVEQDDWVDLGARTGRTED
jgi:hypothetical protein